MSESIATVGDLAGICGSEDGTAWEKILIDASRRLVVAVASAIASDVRLHGYYDGAWQKSPIPWGFSDVVALDDEDTDAAAGNVNLNLTAVPAGEVHVYTHAYAVDYTSNVTAIIFQLIHSASTYPIHREAGVTAGNSIGAPNPIICGPGDNLRGRFVGVTLHDQLYLCGTGYKIDLDL